MNSHEERHEKLRWFLTGGASDVGEIAVREGFLSREQLEECRRVQDGRALVDVLREKGLLTEERIQAVLDIQRVLAADHPSAGASTVLDPQLGNSMPLPVAGRRIGRYRLVEVLGEGGMGVVFRAVDEELGREVALKMLKTAQVYSGSQIERFKREARNTARLRHPGIATLYEIGHEADAIYLVLELIPGKPFDPRAGSLHARVELLEKVARAVQYAHEQGVIHRDLKPGNILVDGGGAPHLLDFGLSRDVEGTSELTRSGAFFGTPSYAPPEQAEGRIHELDARTDVYSLGAVLYEILTGGAPAAGNTIAEILRKVVTEEPARPAGPPDLVTICLKALEKDPARRYSGAAAMADDLARWLRGEPIEAKPISRTVRILRKAKKHRSVLIPAALGALLLAALGMLIARELAGPPAGLLLDDFEQTPKWWKFAAGEEFPGARGGLEIDVTEAHGGKRSYRLDVDLSQGGHYAGVWRHLTGLEGKDVKEIRVWVKTSTATRLGVRFEDKTAQCHQKHILLLPTPDWQELVLRPSEIVGTESWGGAKDRKWHGPANGFGLQVGRDAFRPPHGTRATVWIDDVRVVTTE